MFLQFKFVYDLWKYFVTECISYEAVQFDTLSLEGPDVDFKKNFLSETIHLSLKILTHTVFTIKVNDVRFNCDSFLFEKLFVFVWQMTDKAIICTMWCNMNYLIETIL